MRDLVMWLDYPDVAQALEANLSADDGEITYDKDAVLAWMVKKGDGLSPTEIALTLMQSTNDEDIPIRSIFIRGKIATGKSQSEENLRGEIIGRGLKRLGLLNASRPIKAASGTSPAAAPIGIALRRLRACRGCPAQASRKAHRAGAKDSSSLLRAALPRTRRGAVRHWYGQRRLHAQQARGQGQYSRAVSGERQTRSAQIRGLIMDANREVIASAFALAVIVDQLMAWDALAVSKPGAISKEWADAVQHARANFALAMKKNEFAVSTPASSIPS